jgi:hypothetical protein
MGRYLDLAKRALVRSSGILGNELNEKSEIRVSDPYQDLARTMLAKVTDQPVGMIPWLRQNHSALYEQLINSTPDEIHRLWEGRAALEELECVLDLWRIAQETACEMYRKGQAR